MLIVGGNQSAAGGYNVDNSARFDDGSTDYLYRTFSSDTNRKIYTISVWIKRSKISDESFIIAADTSAGAGNTRDFIRFETSDQLRYTIGGGAAADIKTNRLFRDPSAWYHVVVAVDTSQGTSSNRVKMYINGVQETSFATSSYPSLNHVGDFNDNILHRVGMDTNNTNHGWNGYMSEFVFIDGQQLDPTDLGEFDEDTGIWKPIDVSGLTFGTNGFYLQFQDSSALGDDTSGNSNDFTVNNLTSIDQTTDTPTNNFATLNIVDKTSGITTSEGNTKASANSSHSAIRATFGLNSGKWFWENKIDSVVGQPAVGVMSADAKISDGINSIQSRWYRASNQKYSNGTEYPGYGATYTTGDIIGIALNLDDGEITFYKNGVSQGVAFTDLLSSTDESWLPAIKLYNEAVTINTGNPSFTISSGNSDANGYGNFEYAPPSGYYALCTKNLAEFG